MSCINPGHVIVAPLERGALQMLGMLREHAGESVDLAFSIEDILFYNDLEGEARDMQAKGTAFPFVVRVREGHEMNAASSFSRVPGVLCSVPDFLIRPNATRLLMNQRVVDEALQTIECSDDPEFQGEGISVAVLDTGIERRALPATCQIRAPQLEADLADSASRLSGADDSVGHGTVVALIVNRLAPAASMLSIRVMRERGTMGNFLAGLYLAEAASRPDIFNLSLSISCESEVCAVCQTPQVAAVNPAQIGLLMQSVTKGRPRGERMPIFVAAAGNGRNSLSVPASLSGVIAVGAYDQNTRSEADYSRYRAVPTSRFVLAPGGGRSAADAIATKEIGTQTAPQPFFGTSFSTAFVVGTLARYLGDAVQRGSSAYREDAHSFAVGCLRSSADTTFPNYDPNLHGLGLLRWSLASSELGASNIQGDNPRSREQVYLVVDTTGSMHGRLGQVADHVASITRKDDERTVYRLVFYGDHDDRYIVYLDRVSESPDEIADAIRHAPLTQGDDDPEALEDALHVIWSDIDHMKFTNAKVVVFSDAAAHSPSECPSGFDVESEIKRLLDLGVGVTFVECGAEKQMFDAAAFYRAERVLMRTHFW